MSTSTDERQSPVGQGSSSSATSFSPREDTSCGVTSEKDDEESRSTAHPDEEDRSQESTLDVGEMESRQPDDDYFRPIKKLRMAEPRPEAHPLPPPLPPQKPLTSFFIKDILNHKSNPNSRRVSSVGADSRGIVRPWDLGGTPNSTAAVTAATVTTATATGARRRPRSADDDSRSEKSESDSLESPAGVSINSSPLDALFEMTSKAFEGLDADEKASDPSRDHLNLFSSRQQPKKKRKSRTAFTNHQIFELEKRFLYQKYLSPADRDEIAQSLGLTNAQVITWFQNRRAKLKRDMEELKKDVDAAQVLTVPTSRSIITSIADMNSVKKDLS